MKNKKEKKKYGAGRVFFCSLIAFVIGAIGMCAAFYVLETRTDIDWQYYIEHTLIPNAIAIISAVGTACLVLKPSVDKICAIVNSVVDKFNSVTENVSATVSSSAKSEAEVYESRREIAELKSEIKEIRECARLLPEAVKVIDETKRELEKNTEISKLGFGSMSEHIKNGAAKRIMNLKTVKEESEVDVDENDN